MSISGRFAWNTILNWLRNAIGAAASFFLVRWQMAYLGQAGYGTVELIASIVLFVVLSDLGLRSALAQRLANGVAREDWNQVNEYFNTSMVTYVFIALVASIFCFSAAPGLTSYLEIGWPERPAAIQLIRFYVPLIALISFISPAYGAVLEAYQRFDIQEYVHISEVLFRTLLITLLLVLGLGLYGWAIGMLAGRLLSLLLLGYFAHRECRPLAVRPNVANRTALRALWAIGIYLIVQTAVFQANAIVDPIIISRYLGPDGVAIYKPALLVVTATFAFAHGLSRQLRPLIIGLEAGGQRDRAIEVAGRGIRATILAGIPFTVIVACFASRIVELWLGKLPDAEIAVTSTVLVILAVCSLSTYIRSSQSLVLMGLNRVRFASIVQLVATIAGLVVAIVLLSLFDSWGWGMWSVVGVAIPSVVVGYLQVAVLAVYIGRSTGAGLRHMKSAFLRPCLVLAIVAPCGALLNAYTESNLVSLGTSLLLTSCIWLFTTWIVGFDAADKVRLRGILRRTGRSLGLIRNVPASSTQPPSEAD